MRANLLPAFTTCGVWVIPFPAWLGMCSCNPSMPSPCCSPPTYPPHSGHRVFEVYEVEVPQKGQAEGGGREILWISVLHVVCDEQEDEEEDEECLDGDAVPEEVQHGWMLGLCRDVSHSRSGRLGSQGTTEAPRAGGRWVMCWHSCGCKHRTARSGFCSLLSRLHSDSCFPSFQKGLNSFLIKLTHSLSSNLKQTHHEPEHPQLPPSPPDSPQYFNKLQCSTPLSKGQK